MGYKANLKKLRREAYNKGIEKGFNDACDIWEYVIANTKGIGPTLQQRIKENVRNLAIQILKERERVWKSN